MYQRAWRGEIQMSNKGVCEKADQVLPGSSIWGSSSYFERVALASIPMMVSGILAWLFTRRRLET